MAEAQRGEGMTVEYCAHGIQCKKCRGEGMRDYNKGRGPIEISAMIVMDKDGHGDIEVRFSAEENVALLKQGLKTILMKIEEVFPTGNPVEEAKGA